MLILTVVVTVILIALALIAVLNALTFVRMGRAHAPAADEQGTVSVMIPARNEVETIGPTIRSLLAQSHHRLELLVLDDGSSDNTHAAALATGGGDVRLRVIAGQAVPPGWLGKNWACRQLADQAAGEWLVFTDADVHWEPDALAAVMAEMLRTRADCLTIWPTQITTSWGERLVVPLMAMTILGYLPVLLVHYTPWASLSAANGQCLVFRREAYECIGGHAAVRRRILEDVMLGRAVKAHHLRLRTADAAGLITCRMYHGWAEVRDGFAKNILAGHADSVFFLGLSALFHWGVFVGPWLWLVVGRDALLPGWPVWPLTLIALGAGMRALTAVASGQRPLDALLMPISTVLMTVIAAQSVWWHRRYGGPVWKDRVADVKRLRGNGAD